MANVKITDLTAYTDPVNTDVLPIVDVTSDVTKKVSISNLMKNASAGTAAAPGIAFDGDPNTGIYSPGADQLAISTGGTERARIDSSGRLLVGTSTAPSAGELLRIEKASTGTEGAGIRFGGTYTIADAGTQTITIVNGSLIFISENATGDGALFFCSYKSATVTLVADPNNRYANTVTAGRISLTKSADSSTATLTNNSGASRNFTIGKINNSD